MISSAVRPSPQSCHLHPKARVTFTWSPSQERNPWGSVHVGVQAPTAAESQVGLRPSVHRPSAGPLGSRHLTLAPTAANTPPQPLLSAEPAQHLHSSPPRGPPTRTGLPPLPPPVWPEPGPWVWLARPAGAPRVGLPGCVGAEPRGSLSCQRLLSLRPGRPAQPLRPFHSHPAWVPAPSLAPPQRALDETMDSRGHEIPATATHR